MVESQHTVIKRRVVKNNRSINKMLAAARSDHFSVEDYNAVITATEELSPRQMIIRVAADGWRLPEFEPGQFAVLGLPGYTSRCKFSEPENPPSEPHKLIRRAYSIASSSLVHEFLEFYISLISNGALTPRLFDLKIGDPIWLSPKVTGMFTFDEVPPEMHIILIATGTGLAPYMSMLSTLLDCGGERLISVLHGAYHTWDLGYRSELLTLQHMCSNFTYFATIDRPEDEPVPWNGPVGFVQDMWRTRVIRQKWGFDPTPENTHIFLCGNPAMIEDAVRILSAEGYREHTHSDPGQIHIERY
jgi:ferredoxin--NADP+ reductase